MTKGSCREGLASGAVDGRPGRLCPARAVMLNVRPAVETGKRRQGRAGVAAAGGVGLPEEAPAGGHDAQAGPAADGEERGLR